MKIHITKQGDEGIKGYKHIEIVDGVVNIDEVSDNQCTFILANDIIDEFPLSKSEECIKFLLKKLCLGGTLTVGGTDLRLFCKSVVSGLLSVDEASSIVHSCKSMSDLETVYSAIRLSGLKITATHVNGVHYEVTAVRG